jgi:glycosyltransferase involved in cell wall biosynthesis
MNIGLVCPASLPATQFGGILFLAVDIARESSRLGNNAVIYTTNLDFANNAKTFSRDLPKTEIIENFTIKRSSVWFNLHLFFVNPRMYFQLMKDTPDVIHTIGIRSFQSIIATIVAKNKKIPLIISDQGGLTTHPDLSQDGWIKKILYKVQQPIIKFIINNSTKIIVANEYEKNIFKQFADESKIETIRNGINLDTMITKTIDFKEKYKIESSYILFVGRFSKVKGIDILLQAIKILKNKDELKDIIFVIMGVDFGFQNEMFRMIDEFKINEKILVIKNPSRDDVIAAYRESEFLVLPSRWELSPLTPLEGFSFKKPVISSDVHGIPYTLEKDRNCILIQAEDYNELAESIIKLVIDEEKRIKLGVSGFNSVNSELNSKIMVKKTLKIYETVIHDYNTREIK